MAGMLFSFSSQVEIALNQLYTDPWSYAARTWICYWNIGIAIGQGKLVVGLAGGYSQKVYWPV